MLTPLLRYAPLMRRRYFADAISQPSPAAFAAPVFAAIDTIFSSFSLFLR